FANAIAHATLGEVLDRSENALRRAELLEEVVLPQPAHVRVRRRRRERNTHAGATGEELRPPELERRGERVHERAPQRAGHDGEVADPHALLVTLDRDVELDVALEVAEEGQRHRERDPELLLEERVAGAAAEVEVVQRER